MDKFKTLAFSLPTINNNQASSSSAPPPLPLIAPGFRFHPTDEELLSYYLKRKLLKRPFHFDAIAEIDIYLYEPWDLPNFSRLRTRDIEWYFFTPLDCKNCSRLTRTSRITPRGFWKLTGKDKEIRRSVINGGGVVGFKKTLVYHLNRTPNGMRTDWVMHEYRLANEELDREGISKNGCVVCRIFHKSGVGPKTGEQYGAPYVEEEWEEAVEALPSIEEGGNITFEDEDYSTFYQQLDVDCLQNIESIFNDVAHLVYGDGDTNNGIKDQDDEICEIAPIEAQPPPLLIEHNQFVQTQDVPSIEDPSICAYEAPITPMPAVPECESNYFLEDFDDSCEFDTLDDIQQLPRLDHWNPAQQTFFSD